MKTNTIVSENDARVMNARINNGKANKVNTGKVINKKVVKVAKVKEVSKYKLMLQANKAIKDELYSLSGAIKIVQCLPSDDKFIQAIDIDLESLTPAFIVKNMANVPNYRVVTNNGKTEIWHKVTRGDKSKEMLKVSWSPYNVLQALYYEK